jgi:NAD(P)H-hydrate epimerase
VAARRVVEMAYERGIPTVVDADAIKIFREIDGNNATVVTPHAGEFKEMSGVQITDAMKEADKIKEFAEKKRMTILFKGNTDVITDGKRIKFNRIHNQGMTVGGTGDVLAGITSCLLSKKVEPFNAARMAAFINGMAGNMAYEEKSYGLVATDLIEFIPEVLRNYLPQE